MALRPHQKYIEIPALRAEIVRRTNNAHIDADGTLEMRMGHLGSMLAWLLGLCEVSVHEIKSMEDAKGVLCPS
jgi:hypothetical protein